MSVDERLRTGLAVNTAHLKPGLNSELGVLLGRATRRRRARRAGFAAAAAAISGVLWLLGPLDATRDSLAPAGPQPYSRATVTGPTPLETMKGPLPAGTYAATFPPSDSGRRAVIEVPDGFTTEGTAVFIDDGEKSTGLRVVSFWTVGQIAADPCKGSAGRDPGPTVQDLATALARQPLRGRTTEPVPVSLGGYDGLYLELSVPADLDVLGCLEARVERWGFGAGDRRWQETPGELDRVWIIDVEGRRVVISAAHTPGASKSDIDKLTRVVESITFTNPP